MRLSPALLSAAAPLALLVSAPLFAQGGHADIAAKFHAEFAAMDTNHDGVLTRAEVQARMAQMGTAKGQVDAVHAKRLADLWFDTADANRDGKVTRAEGDALLAKILAAYDQRHPSTPGAGAGR